MTLATISVIIPVLNEANTIENTLLKLQKSPNREIIVVDGGSQDDTVQLAQNFPVKVISRPNVGRANQMNAGAKIASGEILLFLHADTYLPAGYEKFVRESISQPGIIAGAFELGIDAPGLGLRAIEKMVNWRSHFFAMPYGDQAIFVKTTVFQDMGGFPNLPIMEDFELILRLKRRGKIAIAPAAVQTSARRWQKLGIFKTTLINQLIIIGYYLKIPPTQLKNWYRKL
ncbi:MAG: TIGR04283 family arsenosugar biosynthesis glycosyltransferase [Oscillatoria sp. PMC 1051.18]|nr:TIGR04283 family arsenosugar biosynthesis glycosyltransferase [Oscillatoria sp. PMC 1050.18]MEC5028310.1 TIGR04283 family arsenosugar biosynthesis glycosyltransferase [Oscillatoria sp. PMC 1051.18]